MIAYLEGRLLHRGEDFCVLLTPGGVGYEVFVSAPLLSRLPEKGEELQLFTSTIVREDALLLYGFVSWDERETFETLIGISKLGPKTALAMLSVFTPDDLRLVAVGDDPGSLTRVPGIGKKTAQHIFLELKYKLKARETGLPVGNAGAVSAFRDTLNGLTNLGYAEEEVRPVLEELFKEEPDIDVAGALRLALKKMAANR